MDEHEEPVSKRVRHHSDDKYDIEEALDAQESGIARVDDNITFTAFNMDEELQEGHFDTDGTYIFRREKEDVADWWIDNIDRSQLASAVKPAEDSDDDQPPLDASVFYHEIIELINPHETVSKAMQRLGKQSKNGNQKGKRRRDDEQAITADTKDAKEKLTQLISLADRILQTGDTDIYEKTYEQIQFLNTKSKTDDAD